MIIEEAAQLEVLVGEVITLRLSQQHGQSLAHRKQLIDTMLERATTATKSGNAIARRLGEVRAPSPLFAQALARIAQWRSALDEDLGQALGGDLFADFQESVEKAVREVERRATTFWQRYVAQSIPDTSDEILEALAADPRARTTVIRIRRLSDNTLRRLRDRPFPTLDELGEFDTATVEVRNAWSTLDVASLNDEIVDFLRAANSDNGARIALLTPSVLDWLDQHGAAAHYVIRPADL